MDPELFFPVQVESNASEIPTLHPSDEVPTKPPAHTPESPRPAHAAAAASPAAKVPAPQHLTSAQSAVDAPHATPTGSAEHATSPAASPRESKTSKADTLPVALHEHGPEPSSPEVSTEVLRRAMQQAGEVSTPTRGALVPPIVRVDPRERDLDRAFVRAFAWVFYIDPTFFTAVPTGKGKLTVELAEDGRIAQVTWASHGAPARLKELVEKMTKLLSSNHFSFGSGFGAEQKSRSYFIAVTDGHLDVDSELTGGIGDIWMLAAGDTPAPGRPSHPAVADATGHKISGDIRIVEP